MKIFFLLISFLLFSNMILFAHDDNYEFTQLETIVDELQEIKEEIRISNMKHKHRVLVAEEGDDYEETWRKNFDTGH